MTSPHPGFSRNYSRNSPCPCGSGKKYKHCCGALIGTEGEASAGLSLRAKAKNLEKAGQLEKACDIYTSLLKENSDSVELRLAYAACLNKAGNFTEERNQIDFILQSEPESPLLNIYLGKLELSQDKPEQSERFFQKALNVDTRNEANLTSIAKAYLKYDANKAFEYFLTLHNVNSQNIEALTGLASIHLAKGEFGDAEKYLYLALEIDDSNVVAILGLADWLQQQGKYEASLDCLNRAEKTGKKLVDVYERRAAVFNGLLVPRKAVQDAEMALGLDHRNIRAYYQLAEAWRTLGDFDKSNAVIDKLATLENLEQEGLVAAAFLAERNNDLEKATSYASSAIEQDPNNREAGLILARVSRRNHHFEKALKILNLLERKSKPYGFFRRRLMFEKGALLDKLERFDEAFLAYKEGAALRAIQLNSKLDIEKEQELTDQLCQLSKTETLTRSFSEPEIESDLPVPIFIVGFPRSGTTLLESIITAHRDIERGDELPFLEEIVQKIESSNDCRYPDYLKSLAFTEIASFREKWQRYYMTRLNDLGVSFKDKKYFTDKLPLNINYVPLIKMIFPESRIIHIVRNPVDSCLSSIFSDFAIGNEWCGSIENSAIYYLEVMNRWACFQRMLSSEKYMQLRYEDLVENQEYWSRIVLEYIGVDWSEGVLEFFESSTVARTASYFQANKKIYHSSVSRYRNYEKFVVRAQEMLKPVMDRFGYIDS